MQKISGLLAQQIKGEGGKCQKNEYKKHTNMDTNTVPNLFFNWEHLHTNMPCAVWIEKDVEFYDKNSANK